MIACVDLFHLNLCINIAVIQEVNICILHLKQPNSPVGMDP